MFDRLALRPQDRETVAALQAVGEVLGTSSTFHVAGTFYFEMGGPWLLALTPDAGGRFRVAACFGTTEVGSLWSLAQDRRRLADLAMSLETEIKALSAQKG